VLCLCRTSAADQMPLELCTFMLCILQQTEILMSAAQCCTMFFAIGKCH
jgi:hypothetical protein